MVAVPVADPPHLFQTVSNAVVRVLPEQHGERFHHYVVNRFDFSGLIMHRIESDPVTIYRRDQDIHADQISDFLLHLQIDGTAQFRQGSQAFTLERDAIAIVPGGIPYAVAYPEKGCKIILRIPHRVFHERVVGREDYEICAMAFGSDGLVPVVISMLKSLTVGQGGCLSVIEKFALADSFLSLLGSVVRSRGQTIADRNEKNQSVRLSRILAYLDSHFCDHELTPAKLAVANHVSVRHLHSLFQQSGATVSKALWERRLRAGRDDLLDRAMSGLTICEIAYQRGFSDSAHFSRAFKARFGMSPNQFRAQTRKDGAD